MRNFKNIVLAGCFISLFQCIYTLPSYCQGTTSKKLNEIVVNAIESKGLKMARFDKKMLAIVFLSPECPLSQNYSLTLNKLNVKFVQDVDVVGVFPGNGYPQAAYAAFKKKYNINFMLVCDRQKVLTQLLGASKTPEVFLLDKERHMLYKGAIDDWVISLGKTKQMPGEKYLEDAIANTLKGLRVQPAITEAIGCYINN